MTQTLLVLSDLHLFQQEDLRLRGVPTWECFRDVLRTARRSVRDPERIIITGDVAHDELPETYQMLRDELGDWSERVLVVPGNHDQRQGLRQAFPGQFTSASLPDGFVVFAWSVAEWDIVGLDTHQPGQLSGRLAIQQLDWLDRRLADRAHRRTLLFLHHPPVPVDCPWLDAMGLEDPDRLLEMISAHAQVQAVFCGHIHQEFERRIGHAVLHSTPSTAIQFEPGTSEPVYATQPAGFRVIELQGQDWSTWVERLPELRFQASRDE